MPPLDPTAGTADRPLIPTLRRFLPYLWPAGEPGLRLRIVAAMALVILSKLVQVLGAAYTFKYAVDRMAGGDRGAVTLVILLVVGYAAARFGTTLFDNLRNAVFEMVGQDATRRLSADVFRHLHRLSLRFHLERRTGAVTKVVERGTKSIDTMLYFLLFNIAPTVLELALVLTIFGRSFGLVLVVTTIAMVVLYIGFTRKVTDWRNALRNQMNDLDTGAVAHAVDSLLNFETVKYFGAENRETARYDASMERYEKASTQTYVSLAVLNAGQAVILTLGMTAVMWLAARDIMAGRTTIGGFVLVNTMLVQLSMPLNFMGMIYREIKQALIDIDDMFLILQRNPEIADRPGAKPLKVEAGTVRFEDVRFAYIPERPILRGVSFEVPAGRTVAIVGPSGAGKSTLSRLLFRFYEPNAGCITIDGQNIASVRQDSLRAAIGMVPQDTVLFNDTIGYNIRYGRWDASEAEVREAARLAQIDRFIESLPEGYDTPVGERGLKLSGGEKQRVAIARTILKGPPILVLDEATSALDSFTEREIQAALDRVSQGRTTLVIAHRLSTVINADEILVLDQGRVVERGDHTSLLARGGVYAALWNRQREADAAREALKRAEDERSLAESVRPVPETVT